MMSSAIDPTPEQIEEFARIYIETDNFIQAASIVGIPKGIIHEVLDSPVVQAAIAKDNASRGYNQEQIARTTDQCVDEVRSILWGIAKGITKIEGYDKEGNSHLVTANHRERISACDKLLKSLGGYKQPEVHIYAGMLNQMAREDDEALNARVIDLRNRLALTTNGRSNGGNGAA